MPSKADIMRQRRIEAERANGFDVTCVIGRVEFGEGDHTPHEAAFLLIANHDAPGTYSFPAEREGTIEVTVNYIGT
jgi:hypothetical protein